MVEWLLKSTNTNKSKRVFVLKPKSGSTDVLQTTRGNSKMLREYLINRISNENLVQYGKVDFFGLIPRFSAARNGSFKI